MPSRPLLFVAIIILLIWPGASGQAGRPFPQAPLTPDTAAAIAVAANPQLKADLAALGIAQADIQDARLFRNPTLSMLIPVGAKPFELLLNYPIEALWQRPRRIAAAEAAFRQLSKSLEQNSLNTARDARLAHADLVAAERRLKLAEESAALRKRIAELSEARLRAGDAGELEVSAARIEAAAAGEQLARVRQEVTLARDRLRFLLGLALDATEIRVAPPETLPAAPPEVSLLLEKALATRPDLRAAELAIETAVTRAKWERSRIFTLTAVLSSKEVGTSGVLSGPGFNVEIPLFSRNQGQIARADAEVEAASRNYLALKQRVAIEVAESRTQLVQALDTLAQVRGQVLPPLGTQLNQARRAYEAGDVSYLFVLENSRSLLDARLREIDLEAAVFRASANLERNTGLAPAPQP